MILPSVFDEPDVLSANQFHDAKVSLFALIAPSLPIEKPSLPKAVKPPVCVVSA